jgi:hypothetical protein
MNPTVALRKVSRSTASRTLGDGDRSRRVSTWFLDLGELLRWVNSSGG